MNNKNKTKKIIKNLYRAIANLDQLKLPSPEGTGACCFDAQNPDWEDNCLDGVSRTPCEWAGGTYQGDNSTCSKNPCRSVYPRETREQYANLYQEKPGVNPISMTGSCCNLKLKTCINDHVEMKDPCEQYGGVWSTEDCTSRDCIDEDEARHCKWADGRCTTYGRGPSLIDQMRARRESNGKWVLGFCPPYNEQI